MRLTLNNLTNLQQRVIAAAIGGCILVGSILWNEWAYFFIFFFLCMLSMLEFYKLVGLDGNIPLKTYGTISGLFIQFTRILKIRIYVSKNSKI